jgi:hypothetical protein
MLDVVTLERGAYGVYTHEAEGRMTRPHCHPKVTSL